MSRPEDESWMAHTHRRGLKRLASATGFSIAGLKAAWRNEEAFRTELVITVILTPLAFFVGSNAVEYCLLIGVCLVVLITELLNTGIEVVIDRVGTENNELSRLAKDLGSAAVFIGLVLTVLVWTLIAWQNYM